MGAPRRAGSGGGGAWGPQGLTRRTRGSGTTRGSGPRARLASPVSTSLNRRRLARVRVGLFRAPGPSPSDGVGRATGHGGSPGKGSRREGRQGEAAGVGRAAGGLRRGTGREGPLIPRQEWRTGSATGEGSERSGRDDPAGGGLRRSEERGAPLAGQCVPLPSVRSQGRGLRLVTAPPPHPPKRGLT